VARRLPAVPELFLGLLALAIAAVVVAKIATGAIHDARRTRDTISVTGSAREPIDSDLVRWSLVVRGNAPTAAEAARQLRGDGVVVRSFLLEGGVPAGAIAPSVVTSEAIVTKLPRHRQRTSYRVSQELDIRTRDIDVVERVATRIGDLIEQGIDVNANPLAYLSTELTKAKLDALGAATHEARERADIIVRGLGARLGAMRSSTLGVYQITPRDSTEVSDYGINDTSSRQKDVTAVVSATFAVNR
jgi:uncharacterized protein